MSVETTFAAFARALVDPALPPPALTPGRPDVRRFAVYRNNVAVGLTRALEARFPVTRRLVGDEFFRALAGAFIAAHKPRDAVMIRYGVDFPDFARDFAPARELPYLPDVAALENAWVEAYHAAEAEPLSLAALSEVAPERWESLRMSFHPATRLLRFATPAASIWAAHQGEGEPAPPAHWRPEDALVTRPQAEVFVRALPEGGYALFAALRDGATLGEAAAPLIAAGGDPGPHVVGLIEAGAVAGLR
jgi:Putative DNA-binding domain